MKKSESFISIFIVLTLLLGAGFVCAATIDSTTVPNAITEERALARFQELAGTGDVEIVVHSNLNYLVGDVHDVSFELLVDGEPKSGRCTAGWLSPIVCRIYSIN